MVTCGRKFKRAPNSFSAAIASVVLGGVSMGGGRGGISGVVFGCIILGAMSNGLNLMGINTYWQYVVRGIIIITAVYVDYTRDAAELNSMHY